MAYQHFYSRVPARCSMFKRTDGFDTFAKSAEIGKTFIDRELAQLLEYKTTKYEADLIRDGKLPPVYAQIFSKAGEMIQSCISYIPKDYTGERSSHMIHSLVLTATEKLFATSSVNKKTLNEAMFQTDIEPFHVTYANATPKEEYPLVEYVSEKTAALEELVNSYNSKVLKQLIFAVINSICGKGKPVFITFAGTPVGEISQKALDFINTLMLILPFNLRRAISFITYQSDYTKFSNYKIHFLPNDCMAIPTGKGYTFDMTAKLPSGIRDEEYAAQESMIDFFYRIATDNMLRTKFLKFYQGVIETEPSLETPSLKALSAMVTLFRKICGSYDERALLPNDDKVYEMITVYEKYRDALKPVERCAIYECLHRYPASHTVIPNNIFSKVSKLYPTEPAKTKNTVMEVVLELLHTDIMREKLFAFIKNNYAKESPKNRATISENLARVYYGGFLQPQILAFFGQYFKGEEESTRTQILEKLLLSIRTPSIQDKVIEFLTCYYDDMASKQKEMLYRTAFEMLPEGDELTVKMIGFINRYAEKESGEFRQWIAEKLVALCESDQKKKEHRLLPLYLAEAGFCRSTIIDPIFNRWTGRRVFDEFFDVMFTKTAEEMGAMLIEIFTVVPYMPANAEKKMDARLTEGAPAVLGKVNLFRLLDLETKLRENLVGKLNGGVDSFVKRFEENLLAPAITGAIYGAFTDGPMEDPVEYMCAYADTHRFLKGTPGYLQVERFSRVRRQYAGGFAKEMIHDFLQFPRGNNVARNIARKFEQFYRESEAMMLASPDKAVLPAVAKLICGYIQGKASIDAAYDSLYDSYARIYSAENTGIKTEELRSKSAYSALHVLTSAILLMRASEMPDEDKAIYLRYASDDGELLGVVKRAVSSMSNAARKTYHTALVNDTKADPDAYKAINTMFTMAKKSSGGSSGGSFFSGIIDFFKGLFRK